MVEVVVGLVVGLRWWSSVSVVTATSGVSHRSTRVATAAVECNVVKRGKTK